MTYKQIIEQTNSFTTEQRRQLAYFLLYPTLKNEEKKLFDKYFDIKIDFEDINKDKIYYSIQAEQFLQEYSKQAIIPKKTVRKAGLLKGGIKYMANDFDAPLEDLKDYM